jgi:hypothetical protein
MSLDRGIRGDRRRGTIGGVSTLVLDRFEPVSPELVLVSPPDVAALARRALPLPERWEPPVAERPARLTRAGLAGLYAACVATTITPLALALAAR